MSLGFKPSPRAPMFSVQNKAAGYTPIRKGSMVEDLYAYINMSIEILWENFPKPQPIVVVV